MLYGIEFPEQESTEGGVGEDRRSSFDPSALVYPWIDMKEAVAEAEGQVTKE